jgi:hypothetical protein
VVATGDEIEKLRAGKSSRFGGTAVIISCEKSSDALRGPPDGMKTSTTLTPVGVRHLDAAEVSKSPGEISPARGRRRLSRTGMVNAAAASNVNGP